MTELQSVLMRRDDMSAEEALDTIDDLRRRVSEGENPEELLHDELGLEPDYLFDILY
ncbi:MAG: hypothetical protein LBT97_02895 [Planctomycetota bacterium]|jgi:hypothetical protein|nr:hypothetical protein [Planctomycetota bacterium]